MIDANLGVLVDLAFYDVVNKAQPVQAAAVGDVTFPPAYTGPYTLMAAQIFSIVNV